MSQTENPPRVYRYPWRSWLVPLGKGVLAGLLAVPIAAVVFDSPRVILFAAIFAGLVFALNALEFLLQPRRFVLHDDALRVRWPWREDEAATADIRFVDPPTQYEPDHVLALRYGDRMVLVDTSLGGFDDFETELLLRGARRAPPDAATVVRVLGKRNNAAKVPLMMLLKDRTRMDQTAARDCAIQIVNGEQVSIRCRSSFDARALRRELSDLGIGAQSEDTA